MATDKKAKKRFTWADEGGTDFFVSPSSFFTPHDGEEMSSVTDADLDAVRHNYGIGDGEYVYVYQVTRHSSYRVKAPSTAYILEREE